MSSITLQTPAEFVESEFENLKEFLGTYDIQINKVGLVGYLVNLLGNIKYDSQTYYNELFKNAFIPTTIDINSLYLHSAVYNYIPEKAKPSTAFGTINFDFGLLSSPGNDIIKRQVILTNLSFQNNNIQFYSDVQYSFIEEKINNQITYYAILTSSDGSVEYIASPSAYISVPFKDVKQYIIQEHIVSIPNYEYGTYYSLIINSDDKYLFDLSVDIRLADKQYNTSDDYDSLDVKYISYLSNPMAMSCFLKPIDPKNWELKLGSGLHGRYVPNSILKIKKYLTCGKIGNISVADKVYLTPETKIQTFYTSITNGITEKTLNLASVFDLQFLYSYDGEDSIVGQELQKKLIRYIQTRNTLINKQDFYNLKYGSNSEFVYSFRKSIIQQNTFFFYKLISDQYENPVRCLSYNILQINTSNKVSNIIITQEQDLLGELQDAITYKYNIRASDGFNYSSVSDTVAVTIINPNNKVKLTWDIFDNAQYYIISVTTDDINYKYYKTTNIECYDFGNNFESIIFDFSGTDYIYFPQYTINGLQTISPFIYKYNNNMNWYDGYLFYDSFIVNFTKIESNTTSTTLPVCYVQVKYDKNQRKTIFIVKSHQNLTNYEIKLSLSDSSFLNQTMIMKDTTTFSIDYLPGGSNIIKGNHKLTITLTNIIDNIIITFVSASFYQLKKITDQLFLPTFKNDNNSNYILNIPLINITDYYANSSFYDSLFLRLFEENLISENRFPSDNIQCRFLNTYRLSADILKYNTIQEYDFDLVLPLKMSINILLNEQYIISNKIDLSSEQDDIYLKVAQELQDNYTGTSIKYYNSKLIEFIHYSRDYIKQVVIEVEDSNGNIISNGLELLSEQDTIDAIQEDSSIVNTDKKMRILDFFPIYIHWDLDNIDINYRFTL